MAIFTEPYLRTIFPFDSPAGRIVVTFVLTLLPLLYAWVRIRPMDDSEPDTVLGMDAKRLALVTVSLALGAVVFVILGSAFLQPSYDRVCDCNWIADDGRYETMSVYSEYPPTAWIMPLFFVPFGMCAAMVSVHILKREEGGGEPLWAPVHRRLVVVVHHRECGLLEPVGGVDDEELRQWT